MEPTTSLALPEAAPLTPFVVGICLDGVLRDITEPFYRAYVERFGAKPDADTRIVLPTLHQNGEADEYHLTFTVADNPEQVKPMAPLSMLKDEEARPVPELATLNPFNLLEGLTFTDQAETDEFVQGDGFFIFARAPQAESGLPTWLNQLYYGVKARGGSVVLLSNDMLKLRPAALFFAANLGGCFDEVRFVDSAQTYWAGVDVLVTASERLLQARPEDKQVVFRQTSYNNPTGEPVSPVTESLLLPVTRVASLRELVAYYPH
jgi:hypothetical protein